MYKKNLPKNLFLFKRAQQELPSYMNTIIRFFGDEGKATHRKHTRGVSTRCMVAFKNIISRNIQFKLLSHGTLMLDGNSEYVAQV